MNPILHLALIVTSALVSGLCMGWILRGQSISIRYRAMERVLHQAIHDRNR